MKKKIRRKLKNAIKPVTPSSAELQLVRHYKHHTVLLNDLREASRRVNDLGIAVGSLQGHLLLVTEQLRKVAEE